MRQRPNEKANRLSSLINADKLGAEPLWLFYPSLNHFVIAYLLKSGAESMQSSAKISAD